MRTFLFCRLLAAFGLLLAIRADCEAFVWKPAKVGVSAPAPWQPIVDQAVAGWNSKIVRFVDGDEVRVVVGDFGRFAGVGRTQVTVDTRGRALAAVVQLNTYWLEGVYAGQERSTICHELGHVLGLPHSDDPDSCMYPWPDAERPTADDLERLRQLYRGK